MSEIKTVAMMRLKIIYKSEFYLFKLTIFCKTTIIFKRKSLVKKNLTIES